VLVLVLLLLLLLSAATVGEAALAAAAAAAADAEDAAEAAGASGEVGPPVAASAPAVVAGAKGDAARTLSTEGDLRWGGTAALCTASAKSSTSRAVLRLAIASAEDAAATMAR
jgi:hypothetical protein